MFSSIGIATRRLVTQTFTGNGTWTAPATTTRIESASGYGAAGTPSSYSGDVNQSHIVDTILGQNNTGNGSSTSGARSWDSFQNDAVSVASHINGGGTGTDLDFHYTGHLADNTYDWATNSFPFNNAIPGSATVSYSSGWKTTGAVVDGDIGFSTVAWREYGTTTPATTGADTTAFGDTFPGGTGGPATPTSFSNIAVTPGTAYPITVPSGGSLTITYYQ
jgi:hypothetical protein